MLARRVPRSALLGSPRPEADDRDSWLDSGSALGALSFASLLFVAVALSAQHPWTNWLPGWLILAGLPAHTFFHLKGAYALGWFSALWRTFFMLIFAFCIVSFFLVFIVMVGLVG